MRFRIIAVLIGATLAVAVAAAPGLASDGEVRDSCSGGSSEFRLRVRPGDEGRLRVRFEIEGSGAGDRWQLFLSNDGVRIVARTKVADGGGHVRIRRGTEDGAGRDRIAASGVNLDTGESCAGSVSL